MKRVSACTVLVLVLLLLIPAGMADDFVLPASITEIEEGAFRGDTSICDLVIPSTSTTIGDYAFAECKNLSKAYIPSSVTSIGEHSFDGCDDLMMYCEAGSYGETYAEKKGLAPEHKPTTPDPDAYVPAAIGYYNGHTYWLFEEIVSPTEADSICTGLGGYLAALTSFEECEAVKSIFSKGTQSNYFIGATDYGTEGNWRWMNGETWDFTNWYPGGYVGSREPNNGLRSAPGGEDYCVANRARDWRWVDVYGSYNPNDNNGFLCEFDQDGLLTWSDWETAKGSWNAPMTESVKLYSFITNMEWNAECPEWITVEGQTGDPKGKKGTYTIEVTVAANTSENGREGDVVISADNGDQLVIHVTQKAEKVALSSATWNLGFVKKGNMHAGQEVNVRAGENIQSEITWTCSDPDVVTVIPLRGGLTAKVRAKGPGTATITVTTADGKTDSHDMHVYSFPFKWEEISEAIKSGNKTLAQLMDLYYEKLDTDADAEIAKLEEQLKTVITIQADLDPDAQKIIRDKVSEIVKGFKYDVSSYKDVKTGVDLARKVFEELYDDTTGGFTFECKGITYTCSYTVTANIWGTVLSINPGGIVASNGKTYTWAVVSQNSKSIESEMIYLKQFADMKIQEARDMAYSDAIKVLDIQDYLDKAKGFFDDLKKQWDLKSAVWSYITTQYPDLADLIQGISDLEIGKKFNNLKKAYEGLEEPDWTGDLGEKVVSDISGYHEKINTLIEAVDELLP